MGKKVTKEQFIEKARKIHGDKYDYSKTNYINAKTPITIICPIHGDFEKTPDKHLQGQGCKECSKLNFTKRVNNTESFIIRAKEIHGNKYDYSKVNYTGTYNPVIIVCPKHGEFKQRPIDHLSGWGCSKCSGKHKHTTEEWIIRAKEVHGDKYDYSKANYVNAFTKVCIICPEHGEFWQRPSNHVNRGDGCRFCNESHGEREIRKLLDANNITYRSQFEIPISKDINKKWGCVY